MEGPSRQEGRTIVLTCPKGGPFGSAPGLKGHEASNGTIEHQSRDIIEAGPAEARPLFCANETTIHYVHEGASIVIMVNDGRFELRNGAD